MSRMPVAAAVVGALALAAGGASGASVIACPASARQAAVSARPGAARRLVPPGARAVLLCRYSGLDSPGTAFRLTVQRLVDNEVTAARLTRELDALTPATGVYHCPADSAANVVARFLYATGAQDPVTVDLTGCNGVTNGHVHREAGVSAAGRSIVGALARLTTRFAGAAADQAAAAAVAARRRRRTVGAAASSGSRKWPV